MKKKHYEKVFTHLKLKRMLKWKQENEEVMANIFEKTTRTGQKNRK